MGSRRDALSTEGAYRPKTFRPDEMRLLAALVDRVIPATDTPGAANEMI